MADYTTQDVADLAGNVTADMVRKFAARYLTKDVHYRIIGRMIVYNDAGLKAFLERNTKPGRIAQPT